MKSIVDYTNKLKEYFASNSALSNEAVTRSKVGAHNLLPMSLAWIKTNNTQGTWSGNTYTITSGSGSAVYVVDADGDTINGINVTATGTRSALTNLLLCYADFGDTALTFTNPTANGYTISGGENADVNCAVTYSTVSQSVYIRLDVGSTINNKPIYPMIRLESDPNTDFEPYAMTNAELTKKVTPISSNILFGKVSSISDLDTVVDNMPNETGYIYFVSGVGLIIGEKTTSQYQKQVQLNPNIDGLKERSKYQSTTWSEWVNV